MCGIAGAFAASSAPDAHAVVERIVAGQRRRGPDHQAVERVPGTRAGAVLGHDRLSIIDLSEAANQPLWDVSGRYGLVFNGEIYNYLELREELRGLGHSFRTESDSEVILEAFKAWGPAAAERFNGMFAFALYDRQDEVLWLFRDRFGVKPLYYHLNADGLLFASTGTEIARHRGLAPDLAYAARGLQFWVYEADDAHTPYEGLLPLTPGHWLRAGVTSTGSVTTELGRYYDLAARIPGLQQELAGRSDAELATLVLERLEDAIKLRLRADVPLAVSLSGGLDSSSVATLVAGRHADTIGFTFGHPDAPDSEGPQVARLARQAGIDVAYVWPEPARIGEALWETLAAQDAPFPAGSLVAQHLVFAAVRERGIKVLLGGQGGDEAFMGYHKFQVLRLRRLVRERQWAAALAFGASLLPLVLTELGRGATYARALRRYLPGGTPPSVVRLPLADVQLSAGHLEGWQRQAADVQRYSLPTLLRYEDRNSLGNSVESRLPFLDYRLVELGLALPEALKLRGGYGKWILREAVGTRVPASIRWARYKRGFDVPFRQWVANGLGQAIRTRLHGHQARLEPWLAPGVRLDDAFSDAQLGQRPTALAEAMTLAWLAERGA